MGIRFTEDGKWFDPWFRRLRPDHKLLFMFLCEVCDLAGFWEMDIEDAAFRTGLSESVIGDGLGVVGKKGINDNSHIWMENFLQQQGKIPLNPWVPNRRGNRSHNGIVRILVEHSGFCPEVDALLDSVDWYVPFLTSPTKRDSWKLQCIKKKLVAENGLQCTYCGRVPPECNPFHLDHILPIKQGGDDSEENLTLACARCNMKKGALTLKQWHKKLIHEFIGAVRLGASVHLITYLAAALRGVQAVIDKKVSEEIGNGIR